MSEHQDIQTNERHFADVVRSCERLSKLVEQLPPGLRSDWDGTNHYELQIPRSEDGYWWLVMSDIDFAGLTCETEDGKRLGLLLDIAEELSRLFHSKRT